MAQSKDVVENVNLFVLSPPAVGEAGNSCHQTNVSSTSSTLFDCHQHVLHPSGATPMMMLLLMMMMIVTEEEEAAVVDLTRSLFVSAEVSSERSPRRRSISGLSSEKSVAVDNPNSSPFKVPVSKNNRQL